MGVFFVSKIDYCLFYLFYFFIFILLLKDGQNKNFNINDNQLFIKKMYTFIIHACHVVLHMILSEEKFFSMNSIAKLNTRKYNFSSIFFQLLKNITKNYAVLRRLNLMHTFCSTTSQQKIKKKSWCRSNTQIISNLITSFQRTMERVWTFFVEMFHRFPR